MGKDLNVIYEIIWTSFIKQELVVFVSTDRMPGHTCTCARRFAPLFSLDPDTSIDLPLKSKVSLFSQTGIAMETQGSGITVKLRGRL